MYGLGGGDRASRPGGGETGSTPIFYLYIRSNLLWLWGNGDTAEPLFLVPAKSRTPPAGAPGKEDVFTHWLWRSRLLLLVLPTMEYGTGRDPIQIVGRPTLVAPVHASGFAGMGYRGKP